MKQIVNANISYLIHLIGCALDNTIPEDVEFILIGDEAVSYDLLERNKVINQILLGKIYIN